jgi:uncharacterized membrane protein
MSYPLPVEDTLRSAWAKVYGAKQTIWIAFGILLAIAFCLGLIEGIAEIAGTALYSAAKLITNIVSYLLQIGVLYIGICRAKDTPIHYQQMFRAFSLQRALCIAGLYLCEMVILIVPALIAASGMFIMTASFPVAGLIGILVLCFGLIAGIYLVTRLLPSLAIILDQDLGPIQAIKLSFKLTHGNVLRLLLLSLIQILILIISAIPLGIGLIWTLPFTFITYGMIYKNLLQNQTA